MKPYEYLPTFEQRGRVVRSFCNGEQRRQYVFTTTEDAEDAAHMLRMAVFETAIATSQNFSDSMKREALK